MNLNFGQDFHVRAHGEALPISCIYCTCGHGHPQTPLPLHVLRPLISSPFSAPETHFSFYAC